MSDNNSRPLYKAIEMEEFLDLWFYHPLGYKIALGGKALGMTPDQISYISMALGICGGAMLSSMSTAFYGFALIVISSIFDSADGQLARMTGGGTLRGRIIDGLIGYATFTSAYIGFIILYVSLNGNAGLAKLLILALSGAICSAMQSSMYDFYRTTFASITAKKKLPDEKGRMELNWFLKLSYAGYAVYQDFLAASHLAVLRRLSQNHPDGQLPQEVSSNYLARNRRMIRFWNIFGDNTRFIIILGALLARRPEWYFICILGPMNLLLLLAIFLQNRMDSEFLRPLTGEKQ